MGQVPYLYVFLKLESISAPNDTNYYPTVVHQSQKGKDRNRFTHYLLLIQRLCNVADQSF